MDNLVPADEEDDVLKRGEVVLLAIALTTLASAIALVCAGL